MSTPTRPELTEAEQAAAAAAGMSPAEYAHYKDPHAGSTETPSKLSTSA